MRIEAYRKLAPEDGLAAELRRLEALDQAPSAEPLPETLLLWESPTVCAVLPRGGSPADHLCRPAEPGLPVLRRVSGGGSVLLGPGCLNYAFALSLERRPELLDVAASYQAILGALAALLALEGVSARGSDLTWGDRKFAGHAQRRTRRGLLHHGTLLYGFDLNLVSQTLREPARQPPYRAGRRHEDFLTNAPASLDALLAGLTRLAGRLTAERE